MIFARKAESEARIKEMEFTWQTQKRADKGKQVEDAREGVQSTTDPPLSEPRGTAGASTQHVALSWRLVKGNNSGSTQGERQEGHSLPSSSLLPFPISQDARPHFLLFLPSGRNAESSDAQSGCMEAKKGGRASPGSDWSACSGI